MSTKETLRGYLINRVSFNNGCWEWDQCLDSKGYGMVGPTTKAAKYAKSPRVHRISYTVFNQRVPNGLYVLHKCDNRKCLNPDHLFLGTQLDNVRDCITKGRFSMPKGELNPFSKLNKDEAFEIKSMKKLYPARDTAEAYGVSVFTVYSLWSNQSWRHI